MKPDIFGYYDILQERQAIQKRQLERAYKQESRKSFQELHKELNGTNLAFKSLRALINVKPPQPKFIDLEKAKRVSIVNRIKEIVKK